MLTDLRDGPPLSTKVLRQQHQVVQALQLLILQERRLVRVVQEVGLKRQNNAQSGEQDRGKHVRGVHVHVAVEMTAMEGIVELGWLEKGALERARLVVIHVRFEPLTENNLVSLKLRNMLSNRITRYC